MRSARPNNKPYYWIIGICILLSFAGYFFVQDATRVEWFYARHIYPWYSYLPHIVISWLPFSIGDLFYVAVPVGLMVLLVKIIRYLIRRRQDRAYRVLLQFITTLFLLHHFFYLSWGLNYYRESLAQQYQLDVEHIDMQDYALMLDTLITRANILRQELEVPTTVQTSRIAEQVEHIMLADTTFDTMLSKLHIRAKHPVSSTLASYFTVNGYFNPFTHEVQVNALIPWMSYPFTVAHELAHQMGVGFEDECNFIAYQVLVEHPNPWYAYSAHYAAIQSLLGSMRYTDPELFKPYFDKLNPKIIADLKAEQAFWVRYSGPVNYISGIIYNQYLQHNNQPEGTQRYSMMNRLMVAWQKKKG